MKNNGRNIDYAESSIFKKCISKFLIILSIFALAFIAAYVLCNVFTDYSLAIAISTFILAAILMCAVAIPVAQRISKFSASLANRIAECPDCIEPYGNIPEYIENSVDMLAEKVTNFNRIVNEKDSLLKGVFIQSRMRDVYVSLDDVEKSIDSSLSYVMIFIRVHYKNEFFTGSNDDPSKATFFLKQLIELYFSEEENECTTFQIENDKIVSIINVNTSPEHIMEIVSAAIKKLENESEYVFFTFVVSKLCDSRVTLKENFDKLSRLSRYAMPVTETQVLLEENVRTDTGNFYFTIEQMEKLSSFMQNGAREDSLHCINEILDYNIKKCVNGFDLYLLCMEIVNCAVKLLNRLFHAVPATLNLNNVYTQLDRAVTAEEYNKICDNVCNQVIDYISFNKREEDYIISFILDYVENHYAEDIYLNLFAEKLKLTAAYISSYFKEKMNVNLTDYLNSFRIKKAITLIENPQYKNKDIAEAVGLQNINTFIRLFKKYTGYTPGEYRKKHFNDSSEL